MTSDDRRELATTTNLKEISPGILALRPTRVIAVDVGGDALTGGNRSDPRDGQDWQVLNALRYALRDVDVPVSLCVVGLGADGESSKPQLDQALELASCSQAFHGRFQVEGRLADALALARRIGVRSSSACPNIVLDALADQSQAAEIRVPRNSRPRVPRSWLTGCYVFDGVWAAARFDKTRASNTIEL